ncbi:MAG TPA: OB-fold nucleic acid binding domain-containing protein [Candidatus Acidoferrales bacterium]|nr:OB-fold nucleic acid binding domain-containing protein [Candidatus Acidoferrales bacterium]
MKSHFIIDLADGQVVASLFLVREKEIRTSARTGKAWLELSLGDRSGSIPAKMWDNFEGLAKTFERDDVVKVRGRVKLYNGQKELTLEQIIPASERDYDLGDFLPHTKNDVEKLFAGLRAAVSGMKNPWLRQLLSSVVEDPAIAPRLKRAPAAMTMHHAYLGGLLEHIVSLIDLGAAVAAHYPELDSDLLLAGIVLHDIGKIDELRYARGIDYSDAGRLLGHITMGAALVREKCQAISGFPSPLAVLVEHLILSHHGSYEFGSPSLPQTPEAVALHFIDDMDSKMAGIRATLESASDASTANPWTERNPSLRRALLRADKFLAGESGATGASPLDASAGRSAAAGASKTAPQKG